MRLLTLSVLIISVLMAVSQDQLPTYTYDVNYMEIGDSIRMAYLDEGAKDAEVIVMVHGLGGYIKNWTETVEELKEEYRCIVVDLPGYGRSTIKDFEQEDYMEFFSRSLETFVSKMKIKKAHLLGHSMGGQVAVVTALKNPNWLDNLILAAPAGFETFTEQEATMLKMATTSQAFMSHTEPQIRSAYALNFVSMPESVEEMIQDRIKASSADWFPAYAKVREMGVKGMLDHPIRNQLKDIKAKTLVIYGLEDQLIPNRYFHPNLTIETIAEIGNDIPNVTIKLLDTAGHMLQLDQPEAFSQTIITYFQLN